MHLGLIGHGAIGRALLALLEREGAAPARLTLLARPASAERLRAALADRPNAAVVTEAAALVAAGPDLAVECAGQEAVAAHVPALLAAGIDTIVASVGALAEPGLPERLEAAAEAGGARAILPAGAVGGIDILGALRLSGLDSLVYTGRKPPAAWRGSAAEALVELDALTAPAVFFEGDAAEAARLYPKNANVAATLALAGPGLRATRVRLVADPTESRNIHEVEIRAAAGDVSLRIAGHPSPDNPRSSATTVHSLAREVLNRRRRLVI